MGVVFKARQVGLDRVVALKMVLAGSQADERERARFRAEAQAAARLQHPNIVAVYEVGQHQGHDYFSLEFVAGGTLADHLHGQPLSPVESARLVETLARAIHFAHERGVVHRDIKPANVLLSKNSTTDYTDGTDKEKEGPASSDRCDRCNPWFNSSPKITDFGLAKRLDEDLRYTHTGMVMGTPGYMAPEQASGAKQVGPAAALYALGVLLYELLTGRLPFVGGSPLDVMIQATTEAPPPPSRFAPVPAALEAIVLRCLEKQP
jgi:serine/threonine protein kinase